MRLVFMGTPHFAIPSLQALAESRHQVAAVVTNPDRPTGRGQQLSPPPVKECAQALGIDVVQPASTRDLDLADALATLAPDLFVVVAFSILPGELLSIPRFGSVNLHPSLLPAYRGAAPVIWAVVNGEQETGISTFQLNARADAGDILLQRRVGIGPDETAGELEVRLCRTGAAMVIETVDGLEDGTLIGRQQDPKGATRAPKLDKKDGRIDWERPDAAIRNQIRGMNPIPGAFTTWQGQPLKIHRTERADGVGAPGTVLRVEDRQGPVVACGEGALLLTEVQPAGKTAMEGTAFARGYPIAAGALLGA